MRIILPLSHTPYTQVTCIHSGSYSHECFFAGYTAGMQILKRIGGVLLIIIGFIALVTPFTPGAWLMFVGLELIGVRLAIWDKIKARLNAWRGVHTSDAVVSDTDSHLTK